MRTYVQGIGLLGPGLSGWAAGRSVLRGAQPYVPARTVIPPSELLPPAERRRAGVPVKLALAVGREAFTAAAQDAARTATVFASSSSDGDILHQMCEVLTTAEREVSPTKFMNSVHNAAAGYWSIATQSREPSTSLCCYDASFAAGLLEAVVQATVDRRPIGLIACDAPYPEPLHATRPIQGEFGIALVIGPERGLAVLDVDLAQGAETRLDDEELEKLRLGNPAARSLSLLAALARGDSAQVILSYVAGASLRLRVAACA